MGGPCWWLLVTPAGSERGQPFFWWRMTEEQAAEFLTTLHAVNGAVVVCAKALSWLLGAYLWHVFVIGATKGSGIFGRPE